MKNICKKIAIMMMTGVLAAGMSITANAETKEVAGSVTEISGIKAESSVSTQYSQYALYNQAIYEDAIWLNMAQKNNTDKKATGNQKQSKSQEMNQNTQKSNDTVPETKTGQEKCQTSKDDAKNGFSGDVRKDQKADKMPDDVPEESSSQSSVPEKNEQAREEYVDVTAVQDAIDGLTDTDVQTSLQTLLDTYTDAMDSEKAALDEKTSDDSTTLESLHTEVLEAEKALLDALQDADINTENMSDSDMKITKNSSEAGSGVSAVTGSKVEKIEKQLVEKMKATEKSKNIFAKTVDAVGQTINNAGKWVSSLFIK